MTFLPPVVATKGKRQHAVQVSRASGTPLCRQPIVISFSLTSSAKLSRIADTIIRVPLMHAFPWHTSGSATIFSFQFIQETVYGCKS